MMASLIKLSLGLMCSVLSAAPFAQEVQSEVPPEQFAQFLLKHYEVVAVGEFADIPEQAASDFSEHGPKEVILPFEVSTSYQGYVPNDEFMVELAADMLQYPGEDFARYTKRREVFQRLAARFEELEEQLRRLREEQQDGVVSAEEFQEQQTALLALRDEIAKDIGRIPSRQIGAVGFETFYDMGGAIGPDKTYLVALNRSRANPSVLVLDEVPPIPNIFWGRLKDELSGALDRIAGER